jgi:hypothetical protein
MAGDGTMIRDPGVRDGSGSEGVIRQDGQEYRIFSGKGKDEKPCAIPHD